MNMQRLLSIVKKEIIQIKRDRASMVMAFILPLIMLLIFGYAVTTDVEHIKTAVFDQSKSFESRQLVNSFKNTGYFDPDSLAESYKEMTYLIDSGKAAAGIIIPPDYAKKLHRNESTQIQLLVDGSDPLDARGALSNAQVIVQSKSFDSKIRQLQKTGLAINLKPPIELSYRIWYNPNMESRKFNIPGLIGVIMQNITMLLTAFATVRERERGTLEQLIITPVKPLELIVGKLIPYAFIGFWDMLLVLCLGVFWFNVPINGSIIQLLLLSLIFLIAALGFGMFVSTVSKTQLQAMQVSFMIILPSILLSGFMFPRDSMPKLLQILGNIIPLTYFIHILRGIILKGVGSSYLWTDIIPLIVFAIGILFLSVIRMKKRLE